MRLEQIDAEIDIRELNKHMRNIGAERYDLVALGGTSWFFFYDRRSKLRGKELAICFKVKEELTGEDIQWLKSMGIS